MTAGAGEIHNIQKVLKHDRVIHWTAFDVSTVREDLLRKLLLEYLPPMGEPPICLRAPEETAGEKKCLRVREQMIAEQVRLQTTGEITRLDSKAVHRAVREPVPGHRPLDPIDNTQRGRIRLPANAYTWRVLGDPAQNKHLVPLSPRCSARGDQVVEIVQVV